VTRTPSEGAPGPCARVSGKISLRGWASLPCWAREQEKKAAIRRASALERALLPSCRMSWRRGVAGILQLAGVAAASSSRTASAEPAHGVLDFAIPRPPARLTGTVLSPGHGPAEAQEGLLLGIGSGWSTLLPSSRDAADGAWSLGARLGYQLRYGLALDARYDYLGVAPHADGRVLQTGAAGLRYSLPWYVEPFAEAALGCTFHGADVSIGGGVGLGISLPVGQHLAFDLALRDWITPLDGEVRHVLSTHLGVTLTFGRR